MTTLTLAAFKKISKADPNVWIKLLNDELAAHGMNTKNRMAMFLAQAAHESAGFLVLKENLNYSAEGLARTWPSRFREADGTPNIIAKFIAHKPNMIAQHVYCGRMGNGELDESNDGMLFTGRGIFQLTGRTNYELFFKWLGEELDQDKLLEPEYAVKSAIWYWVTNNLNKYADSGDITTCTKRINGGTIGLAHRKELYNILLGSLT